MQDHHLVGVTRAQQGDLSCRPKEWIYSNGSSDFFFPDLLFKLSSPADAATLKPAEKLHSESCGTNEGQLWLKLSIHSAIITINHMVNA